jgi:hypothetical protein
MERRMYRAQVKRNGLTCFNEALEGCKQSLMDKLKGEGVITATLFAQDRDLFIYAECLSRDWDWSWPEACEEWLEAWPGEEEPRYTIELMDVFHDGVPLSVESWRGGRIVTERRGSMTRLKPEMVASYIFYHYQKQEEKPSSFNKTYIIGNHENWLFSYSEMPSSLEEPVRQGKLNTNLTPDGWHSLMAPHFQPWSDGEERDVPWRKLDILFSYDG